MKLPACAAVVLAVGAGLGTYFALGGPPEPQVPKMHKNALLEAATSKGIIGGYRAIRHQWGVYSYECNRFRHHARISERVWRPKLSAVDADPVGRIRR